MKTVVKTLGVVASLFVVMNVSAQTGAASGTRYGKGQDSVTCVKNFSLFKSDFDLKNYDAAIVHWRKVWRDCPLASNNLTLWGAQMYKYYIEKELNADKKSALIDTIMQVWEKGMVLRPQAAANYRQYMLEDMLKYWDTPENQSKIQIMLEKQMSIQKENTSALTYASYMRIIMAQNTTGQLSDEELLENYTKISDLISNAIKKTSNEELAKARDMIDEQFVNSSAAGCENLLKIYGAKYEANKNDTEFLRKLTRLLNRKECTDSKLFENASEQMYALNPSSDAAYNMAKLFFRRGNYDKAIEYYENAIKSESEPFDQANYYYQLGTIMLSHYKKYNEAKKCALEAIKLRPDWGLPYVLLANTYANGPKCGEDDFEQRYIYWVVVDKLQKAKTVDPDISTMVNSLISQYSQSFPKKEEGFFRNIIEGSSVTIPCWINESTKVRYNN